MKCILLLYSYSFTYKVGIELWIESSPHDGKQTSSSCPTGS